MEFAAWDAQTDNAGLRGDYQNAARDFTVDQAWASYGPEHHDRWRRLYTRQADIVARHAIEEFTGALARLDCGDSIPKLDEVSGELASATGWRLVAVPGLIPNKVFFYHLARRQFPITRWIREERELDYIVEPDIFHDFYGHVPLLFDRTFADAIQLYGHKGLALEAEGAARLARLYWYVVEFGLLRTAKGLKALGAGILSSATETEFSVLSPAPNRISFSVERVLRTRYRIDDFQETYFVLDQLIDLTVAVARPLDVLIARACVLPDLEPGQVLQTDSIINRGSARLRRLTVK